jgi:hypothetical protein
LINETTQVAAGLAVVRASMMTQTNVINQCNKRHDIV